MSSEVDKLLREYLERLEQRDRDEEDGVRKAIGDLSNQVIVLGQKIEAHNVLQHERYAGLAARVERLEERGEVTGNHNIENLNKQLAEAKDKNKTTWGYILAVIGAAVVMFFTAVGTVVWALIRSTK